MLTGSEMQLVVTISNYVMIKNILIWYNKKANGKKDMPFPEHDFRLRHLFGKSPDLDQHALHIKQPMIQSPKPLLRFADTPRTLYAPHTHPN